MYFYFDLISIVELSKPLEFAVNVAIPFSPLFCNTTRHFPLNALRLLSLKRSIDVWQPLSTPAMKALPLTSKLIRFSERGHKLLSLSSTSTVTKLKSFPSDVMIFLSGVSLILCGVPAVCISFSAIILLFFLATTLTVPGMNLTLHTTCRLSSSLLRIPCDLPFMKSSTSSALL